MPISVRSGGAWKEATPYVKTGGAWKPVLAVYVKTGGAWRASFEGGAVNWANIFGSVDAENADQAMPWTTTLTLSLSGVAGEGMVYYEVNNGGPTPYSGPFAVTAGQLVHFGAIASKSTYSATATVTRTGGAAVDTFTITLT